MQTETINHGNGNSTTYKKVDDMWFHIDTPQVVCDLLNALRLSKTRVKIYCGDVVTGKAWIEENDSTGTIGRSVGGKINIPLLLNKVMASGGHGILDHCIVGIRTTVSAGNKFLYRHPTLITPKVEIKTESDMKDYTHETWVNGELYGRHRSFRSAQICQTKIA